MWVSVDVEADGPVPGLYSMIEIGAVAIMPGLTRTFGAKLAPISDQWQPEALAVTGYTRADTESFPDPKKSIMGFDSWLYTLPKDGRLIFLSDNAGFDWQFINYYFWKFLGRNPFGHSSNNLRNIYNGMKMSSFESFRGLRDTPHTHDPVDDAMGNAQAFQKMVEMGYKI